MCQVAPQQKKQRAFGDPLEVHSFELNVYGTENADVWATNGWSSIVVEVKTSKSDFHADFKKNTAQLYGANKCQETIGITMLLKALFP